jgi:hypothetical protein
MKKIKLNSFGVFSAFVVKKQIISASDHKLNLTDLH